MKLHEIFQTQVTNVDYDGKFPRGNENLGGVFSFTSHDEDPHMIRKSHKKSAGKAAEAYYMLDAFPYYARIVYENQLWDEVHFPRIYEVKKVGTGNDMKYTWRMERLRELSKLKQHQLESIADIYFGGLRRNNPDTYPQVLANHIRMAYEGGEHSIKDEQLLACVRLLKDMKEPIKQMALEDFPAYKRELSLFSDLHAGNIMIRLSSTSPQLILLDPFAFTL